MALPEGVKADDVEATTVDGVLELKIPLPTPNHQREHPRLGDAERGVRPDRRELLRQPV
jgi:Hsp20/alpha crystallin family